MSRIDSHAVLCAPPLLPSVATHLTPHFFLLFLHHWHPQPLPPSNQGRQDRTRPLNGDILGSEEEDERGGLHTPVPTLLHLCKESNFPAPCASVQRHFRMKAICSLSCACLVNACLLSLCLQLSSRAALLPGPAKLHASTAYLPDFTLVRPTASDSSNRVLLLRLFSNVRATALHPR